MIALDASYYYCYGTYAKVCAVLCGGIAGSEYEGCSVAQTRSNVMVLE